MRGLILLLISLLLSLPVRGEGQKIWILVIGISDYQYLNDLNYADKDAQAFLAFAKESLGEKFVHDQVRMLLNEKATYSSISLNLEWIIRNSSAGDRAYIYFSGHGGYEELTVSKLGYLHAYDSYDATYANGGNISLSWLDGVMGSLSQKEVESFLILDACHSGKITDSDYLFLNNSLSTQIPRVNKILSAQGMEKSYEDAKWGGGHGVFTYYLLNGILGYADDDPGDKTVSLYELEKYLINNVPRATNQLQIPIVIATDKRKRMFPVIKQNLAEDDSKEMNAVLSMARNIQNISNLELTEVDQKLIGFQEFINGVDLYETGSSLIFNEHKKISQNLSEPEKVRQLTDIVITYVMNYAQQYINVFMGINEGLPNELKSKRAEYHLHEATTKALLLIDFDHPSYGTLDARRYFFESEIFHNRLHDGEKLIGAVPEIVETLDYAISLDSRASYLKYLAGVLNFHAGDVKLARDYLMDARNLSPNWSFPEIVIGLTYEDKNIDMAATYYQAALKKFPKTPALYLNIADFHMAKAGDANSKSVKRIHIDSVIFYHNLAADVGSASLRANQYEQIGDVYLELFEDWKDDLYRKKAIDYFIRSILEGSENTIGLCSIVSDLGFQANTDSPVAYFFWGISDLLGGLNTGMSKIEQAFELGYTNWEMMDMLPSELRERPELKAFIEQNK